MNFYDAPKQNRFLASTITIVLLLAVGLVIAIGAAASKVAPKDDQSAGEVASDQQTPPASVPSSAISANYMAIITNYGDIIVKLFPDAAPKTVKNFATLAKTGYYDGLIFHRVVKDFVIQGGDPNGDGSGGSSIYGPTFEDEINASSIGVTQETQDLYHALYGYVYRTNIESHKMEVGSVAMANRGANTNGSQFFIVTKNPQPSLDGKHTVFGQVIDGMNTVESINNVAVGHSDRPVDPVTMIKILVSDSEDDVRSQVNNYHSSNASNE